MNHRFWSSLLLALVFTLVMNTAFAMTPGTYLGTMDGVHNDVKVALEVTEDRIENAWVVEIDDYPILSEKAAASITAQIVEKQSTSVDALSGATLTSYAIMGAARNALTAAGAASTEFAARETVEKTAGEPVSVDVVVVGAGPAGLTAALSAATDSELSAKESGLSVLVVESMGFGGGSMTFSGGVLAAYSGSPLNDATGVSNTREEVEANFAAWGDTSGMNQTIMDKSIDYAGQVLNGLNARNFALEITEATLSKSGDLTYTLMATKNPLTGDYLTQNDYYTHGGAAWMADSLVKLVQNAGIEIRFGTTATEITVADGVCTGIVVEDKYSTYPIEAKKVILATGFADSGSDTQKAFFPDRPQSAWSGPAGNHAFAAKQIVAMGGEASIQPKGKATLGSNATIGYFGPSYRLLSKYPGIWVNSNGERFFDESGARGAGLFAELEKPVAYVVIDSTHPSVPDLAAPLYQRVAFQADTIEELATKMNVPADTLAATVAKYNEDYDNGGDTVFGTPKDAMAPVKEGPFYALTARLVNTSEYVGVYADDDCTVLLSADGPRIENLLGAGGAICNTYLKNGLGAGLLTALTTGTYAGECARTAILSE